MIKPASASTPAPAGCTRCQELKHYLGLALKCRDGKFAALERRKLEEHILTDHSEGVRS